MTQHQLVSWLNSLLTVPSALLTQSLLELSDGATLVDVARHLQVAFTRIDPSSPSFRIFGIEDVLQWLAAAFGRASIPPELQAGDVAARAVRAGDLRLIASLCGYLKSRHDECEMLQLRSGGTAELILHHRDSQPPPAPASRGAAAVGGAGRAQRPLSESAALRPRQPDPTPVEAPRVALVDTSLGLGGGRMNVSLSPSLQAAVRGSSERAAKREVRELRDVAALVAAAVEVVKARHRGAPGSVQHERVLGLVGPEGGVLAQRERGMLGGARIPLAPAVVAAEAHAAGSTLVLGAGAGWNSSTAVYGACGGEGRVVDGPRPPLLPPPGAGGGTVLRVGSIADPSFTPRVKPASRAAGGGGGVKARKDGPPPSPPRVRSPQRVIAPFIPSPPRPAPPPPVPLVPLSSKQSALLKWVRSMGIEVTVGGRAGYTAAAATGQGVWLGLALDPDSDEVTGATLPSPAALPLLLADGVLLAQLVAACEGQTPGGGRAAVTTLKVAEGGAGRPPSITVLPGTVLPRPDGVIAPTAATKNLELALTILRARPRVPPRFVWAASGLSELVGGSPHDATPGAVELAWGLLEDIRRGYGGAGTAQVAAVKARAPAPAPAPAPAIAGSEGVRAALNTFLGGGDTGAGRAPATPTVAVSEGVRAVLGSFVSGAATGRGPSVPASARLPSNPSVTSPPLQPALLSMRSPSRAPAPAPAPPPGPVPTAAALAGSLAHLPATPSSSTRPRLLPVHAPVPVPRELLPSLPASAAVFAPSPFALAVESLEGVTGQGPRAGSGHGMPSTPRQGITALLSLAAVSGTGGADAGTRARVRAWLHGHGLPLPLNEDALRKSHPLDGPLTNGSLLAALMPQLEPRLPPLGGDQPARPYRTPRSIGEARANIEAALTMLRIAASREDPSAGLPLPQVPRHLLYCTQELVTGNEGMGWTLLAHLMLVYPSPADKATAAAAHAHSPTLYAAAAPSPPRPAQQHGTQDVHGAPGSPSSRSSSRGPGFGPSTRPAAGAGQWTSSTRVEPAPTPLPLGFIVPPPPTPTRSPRGGGWMPSSSPSLMREVAGRAPRPPPLPPLPPPSSRKEAAVMAWLSSLGLARAVEDGDTPVEGTVTHAAVDDAVQLLIPRSSARLASPGRPQHAPTLHGHSPGGSRLLASVRGVDSGFEFDGADGGLVLEDVMGPLCDGTLLGALALLFTGKTVPDGIEPFPRTAAVARANIRKALSALCSVPGMHLARLTAPGLEEAVFEGRPRPCVDLLADLALYHATHASLRGSLRGLGLRVARQRQAAPPPPSPLPETSASEQEAELAAAAEERRRAAALAELIHSRINRAEMAEVEGGAAGGEGEDVDKALGWEDRTRTLTLLRWLTALGITPAHPGQLDEAGCTASDWSDGLLLCSIVSACENLRGMNRSPIHGIDFAPTTGAARLSNVRRALTVLRALPSMPLELLYSEMELRDGCGRVWRRLLAQVRRAYGHHLPGAFHAHLSSMLDGALASAREGSGGGAASARRGSLQGAAGTAAAPRTPVRN